MLNNKFVEIVFQFTRRNQKSIEPSPLRPQTTMAIERVKTAAKAAQAKVKSIEPRIIWYA